MSHDLCPGMLSALLPLIKTGLGLSYLQSGLLLSSFTITSGLSQFAGGWFGDKFKQSSVIAVGLGGVGLAALAAGLNPVYYPLLAIMIFMGIMSGGYHPSAITLLTSGLGEDKRGKIIALHMVGGSIGFSLGPILGGLIAEALGWRFSYIILSVPPLIAALLIILKYRQQSIKSAEIGDTITDRSSFMDEPETGKIGIGEALRPVALVIALVISTQLIGGTAMAFLPVYLFERHAIAPASATMLMGLVRGGGILGSFLGGWSSDKWGKYNTLFIALLFTGPVLYLLTVLPLNAGVIVLLAVFGMIMYIRQVVIQSLLIDSIPVYLRTTVVGIYFGLSMEGTSLLQPVAGHYMDIFGIVNIYHVVALMSIGLSLLSLLLVKRLEIRKKIIH